MDVISYQKAAKARDALKFAQDRLGMNGTEQGLDIRDKYETVDERVTELEKNNPEIELYNRVSEVSAHTAINLNKHNLRLTSLLNQSRYKLTDMLIDDFSNDSGIDYERSFNIDYDEVNGVIKQDDSLTSAELVLVAEAFDHMGLFIVNSLVRANLKKQVDVDLSEGQYGNTEYTTSISLIKKEDQSYALHGVYETNAIHLANDVSTIDEITIDATIPEEASLTTYIALSNDGINFTEYSIDLSDAANYVKLKFEFEAALEVVVKALQLQILEGNGAYKGSAFVLNHEGDNSVLKRNLQKYNGLTFDTDKAESYKKGSEYLYRIKRTVNKGWNR